MEQDFEQREMIGEILPASQSGQGREIAIEAKGNVITSRRYETPRDLRRVQNQIKALAAMAGKDWYYRWPVKDKKKGTTTWVEGPSVKCASAVARMYGNCEVYCGVKDVGSHWLYEATFIDYETGFKLTRPFQQRKKQNVGQDGEGGMGAERAADIVFQIGTSKATRNVVCNALETFTDFAMEEAKKGLVERIGKNLPGSREKILSMFADQKIDIRRVELVYARKAADWLAPDIAKMFAEITAIADGMANKDETYPPTPEEEAKADAEAKAAVASVSDQSKPGVEGQQQAEEEPTLDEWGDLISIMVTGLAGCKTVKEVNEFIEENEPTMKSLSKAPQAINDKWTSAFQKRMKEVSPMAEDKKDGKGQQRKML